MKVNISYSVAIEKVLPVIEKLYEENKQEFNTLYNETTSIIEASFTDDGLQGALSHIKKLREGMVEFDGKLGELLGIATGYQQIINGNVDEVPSPPFNVSPEEPNDESV
jgi:hypothetical protein